MTSSPLSPELASEAEMQERADAARGGEPYVVYRDARGRQQVVMLGYERGFAIGRGPDADISLFWDDEVSGLHAELRCSGGSWLIADDGLSRNGTFVNGERVRSSRRLIDGDEIEAGQTALLFLEPFPRQTRSTVTRDAGPRPPEGP